MGAKNRRAQAKRAKKNIASAVGAGGLINIGKASDVAIDVISRSKSKQRGAARTEQLKRATTGKFR